MYRAPREKISGCWKEAYTRVLLETTSPPSGCARGGWLCAFGRDARWLAFIPVLCRKPQICAWWQTCCSLPCRHHHVGMQDTAKRLSQDGSLQLPGAMKFAGEGGIPNPLIMLGELKSSISSLNMIPLTLDRTSEPKLEKTSWRRHVKTRANPERASGELLQCETWDLIGVTLHSLLL